MTLRVLVVSDVRIVQEGLRAVLGTREEIEVVSTVDLRQAGERCARLQPQVVLFDAARRESVEYVRDVVRSAPACKVVAFGVHETDEEILPLAAAGTAGYVRAGVPSDDLVGVIEGVMRDELPCSARAAASLYREVATLSRSGGNRAERTRATARVSRRELQVARLIDRGLSNKQIARALGIEPATVKNHVHNLCGKLSVHRRGAAAAQLRSAWRGRGVSAWLREEAALATGR
ncbi:MAG TPA: response regulator transcription factor [Steroidobacteraceae bacterium]|nr:response regulator transcription factor [Steroidobacteraceae bacterium]